MNSDTLISYQVISLSSISLPEQPTHEQAKAAASQVVQNVHNVPVELRGEASPLFVIALFAQLRSVAVEVTYRAQEQQPAILIWSTLGDEFLRPQDVIDPARFWSDKDMQHFEQQWNKEAHTQIHVDLTEMWNDAELQQFLQRLYTINPTKERVVITGMAPGAALLYTYNWFLIGGTTHIEYVTHA